MNNIKVDKLAPVIIPTLNRKEHLERCLNSLARNPLAAYTDIVISVDYPPSKKYIDGYNKVKDYLNNNKYLDEKFRTVTVFFQKINLGPERNFDFLVDYIKNQNSRYITSEDDNEFSPNFLEYINKGLELFENDEEVLSICGCKETEWYYNENSNVLLSKLYSGYGVGHWIEKENKLKNDVKKYLLEEINIKKISKLKKDDRILYNIYIVSVLLGENLPFWKDNKLAIIDSVKSIYMHFREKYCIVPVIGKSRTWGNDGSGLNMPRIESIDPERKWLLDIDETFDYNIGNDGKLNYIEYNDKLEENYMKTINSIKFNLKADLGYILLRICLFDREKAIIIKNKLRGRNNESQKKC